MTLLYACCVPILTFGAEVKEFSGNEMRQLNVAINNAVRRIFGFRRWESIRQLREFYLMKPIEQLFLIAKRRFRYSVSNHINPIILFLADLDVF